MERLYIKLLIFIFFLLALPFFIVFALPRAVIRKYKRKKYSNLYTLQEKNVVFKAQNLLKLNRSGIVTYDDNLLKAAEAIENARFSYQNDPAVSFSNYLLYELSVCTVSLHRWEEVNNYYSMNEVLQIEGEIDKNKLLEIYFSRTLNKKNND